MTVLTEKYVCHHLAKDLGLCFVNNIGPNGVAAVVVEMESSCRPTQYINY